MERELDLESPTRPATADGPGLGDLFRQLARDGGELLRQEIRLAKLEVAEATSTMVLDTVQILVALAIAAIGGLALVVALILGIGVLLGGAYWAGALITGVLLLSIGGGLAARAVRELKNTSLKPEATLETLQQDRDWARDEARALARGVRS